MQNKQFSQALARACVLPLVLWGCASGAPKADIAANANPNDEITRLRTDINQGEANDFAVLDKDDFNASQKHLASAEEMIRDNKKQESILDQVREARGYYQRAEKLANERRGHIQTVLDARDAAVTAGALKFPQTKSDLMKVDETARDMAEKSATPHSEDVSKLQARYGQVQLDSLVADNLGNAQATLNAAKSQNADSRAPKTLNQAKVDFDTAKNAISMNRNNASSYTAQVRTANLSADTLAKVMEMSRKGNGNFNEDEAVRIVMQDRRIHELNSTVTDQNSALSSQQGKLSNQAKDLAASQAQVKMQQALESAQQEFSSQEAEVYQQGNNLLIRLKSIGFKSGSADLPKASDDLLAKVQDVVKGLNPKAIEIQGHTDSTGSKKVNESLSEKRAQEVAGYFEKNGIDSSMIKTEGYGDSKPLSTNKTKEGRAQNRRIDIIVTPTETM